MNTLQLASGDQHISNPNSFCELILTKGVTNAERNSVNFSVI